VGGFKTSDNTLLIPSLIWSVINAFQFYLGVYVLFRGIRAARFPSKQWYIIIGVWAAISILEFVIDDRLYAFYYPSRYKGVFMPSLWTNLFMNVFIYFAAWGFRTGLELRDANRRQHELEQIQRDTELALLRNQINPHFLFNALNNLFGMARKHGDSLTANGIARLSGLMRYMLYESNYDQIPLASEWGYLRNYIALQQMRYTNQDPVIITFEITGDPEDKYIPPMLLITPVENAFKHGIRIDKPSFVKITGHVTDSHFHFTVLNSYFPDSNVSIPSEPGGIGRVNLRKRIALLYPEENTLEENQTTDTFKLVLHIPLLRSPSFAPKSIPSAQPI